MAPAPLLSPLFYNLPYGPPLSPVPRVTEGPGNSSPAPAQDYGWWEEEGPGTGRDGGPARGATRPSFPSAGVSRSSLDEGQVCSGPAIPRRQPEAKITGRIKH